MICTNKSCGKKFNVALDLFNGISTCPHCKKELTVIHDFKITQHSEALYNLSELYFFRYLSPQSYKPTVDGVLALSPAQLLEKAIEICSEAAKDGHPKAVYKMGYYNEHYLDTSKSESDRMRKAFDYYSAICFYDKNSVPTEKSVKSFSGDEFEAFKRNAATCLLNLLTKYPRAFKGANKYDYETNNQRIISMYGAVSVNKKFKKSKNVGKSKSIRQILTSCFSKERAPLFGLFFLGADDLKDLFDSKKTEKGKQNFLKFISKGLDVRFLQCNSEGVVESGERYFTRFKSEDKLKQFISEIANGEFYYLYFFNTHGKHAFLSNSMMEKVKTELQRDDYELIGRLIDFQMLEYLFFDDDIMQFKKGGIRGSSERLIDYVCGGDL